MDTLRVSEDTIIEVVGRDGDHVLFLRNENSPNGVVILPDEVKALVNCLSVAAGLLAQEAAAPTAGPLDPLARAKADLAALERGEQVDLSAWGVKDLRATG